MRVEGLKSVQNFDKAVFLEDADEYCDGSKSDVNATNTINNMGKYEELVGAFKEKKNLAKCVAIIESSS